MNKMNSFLSKIFDLPMLAKSINSHHVIENVRESVSMSVFNFDEIAKGNNKYICDFMIPSITKRNGPHI